MRRDQPTYCYRLYDSDGWLIYVGTIYHPIKARDHLSSNGCMENLRHAIYFRWELYNSRSEARKRRQDLIERKRPIFNLADNPRYPSRPYTGEALRDYKELKRLRRLIFPSP